MTHWIVFEKAAAEATRHSGQVEERSTGDVADAIAAAAHDGRTLVVVLPSGDDRATVARITAVHRGA